MSDTRRLECSSCSSDFTVPLQHGFKGPNINCPACGAPITDHASAVKAAEERLPDVAAASAIALRYTYDQMMSMAHKLSNDPAGAAPDEVDAVSAFCMLRDRGLPCHAPPTLS